MGETGTERGKPARKILGIWTNQERPSIKNGVRRSETKPMNGATPVNRRQGLSKRGQRLLVETGTETNEAAFYFLRRKRAFRWYGRSPGWGHPIPHAFMDDGETRAGDEHVVDERPLLPVVLGGGGYDAPAMADVAWAVPVTVRIRWDDGTRSGRKDTTGTRDSHKPTNIAVPVRSCHPLPAVRWGGAGR